MKVDVVLQKLAQLDGKVSRLLKRIEDLEEISHSHKVTVTEEDAEKIRSAIRDAFSGMYERIGKKGSEEQ